MKIGERGQVTIPQHLREAFALKPGTEVDFVVQDERLVLVKKGVQREIDRITGRKQFDRSTDELMKLLRE